MLELQLVKAGTVLATSRFATTLFAEDWSPVDLVSAAGAHVNCFVRLRGAQFLGGGPAAHNAPSAPLCSDVAASELIQSSTNSM